jgi:predicted RNase H-like HicB family nuclease
MREYAIVFEKGPTSWGAHVPDLPGLFAAGKTFEETDQLIREGIVFHIECLRADGHEVPEPTTRVAMAAAA